MTLLIRLRQLAIRGVATTIVITLWAALPLRADDNWPQFRGKDARGVVEAEVTPPSRWSATENIAWKHQIGGRGWSSPIVWGNQVFVTTVVNLGESEEPKKGLYFGGNRPFPPESLHQWVVLCLDLNTGEQLWRRQLHEGVPQGSIHLKNSFASETPVTDGEHIYVYFGNQGVHCLDFAGNVVWSRPVAAKKTRYGWGPAASPVLHEDRLYIVNDNDEESYVAAYDKHSGEEIWRVARDERSNWATPFIWNNQQRAELITPGSDKIRSYDLAGNLLWSLGGMSSITIATPYAVDGLLFITSGYVLDEKKPMFAIRPGAAGDISLASGETSSESIAWFQPDAGPYNPSTIIYNGILYVLYDKGFLAAFNAQTGEEIYPRQRLPRGRAFTSSPWAYDGKIFCLNEDGVTFVIRAGDQFEILHTNSLGDDDMGMATPAIVGARLLIRTTTGLYCVR